MERICRSALINYSARQMFELVDDIENYHLFVPHCQASKVIERNPQEVIGELKVAKSGIAKSFITKNTLEKYNLIKMELVEGPFSYLSGDWKFTELSDSACKIELDLKFEFSNKLASLLFTKVFSELVESMVKAFTDRAEKIYAN